MLPYMVDKDEMRVGKNTKICKNIERFKGDLQYDLNQAYLVLLHTLVEGSEISGTWTLRGRGLDSFLRSDRSWCLVVLSRGSTSAHDGTHGLTSFS